MKQILLPILAVPFLFACTKSTDSNYSGSAQPILEPYANSYIMVSYMDSAYQIRNDLNCYYDNFRSLSIGGSGSPNIAFELQINSSYRLAEGGEYKVDQIELVVGHTTYKFNNGTVKFDNLSYFNNLRSGSSGTFQAGYDPISQTYALLGSFSLMP